MLSLWYRKGSRRRPPLRRPARRRRCGCGSTNSVALPMTGKLAKSRPPARAVPLLSFFVPAHVCAWHAEAPTSCRVFLNLDDGLSLPELMLKPCILPAEPLILFREGIFAPGFPAAFCSQPLEGPLIALLSPRRQMGRVKTFPTKERPEFSHGPYTGRLPREPSTCRRPRSCVGPAAPAPRDPVARPASQPPPTARRRLRPAFRYAQSRP